MRELYDTYLSRANGYETKFTMSKLSKFSSYDPQKAVIRSLKRGVFKILSQIKNSENNFYLKSLKIIAND